MTEPRREALRALVAARADKGDRWTRDTYQTLVRWLDDPTESPDPELALLEAVAACRGRPQDGFWAVAQPSPWCARPSPLHRTGAGDSARVR